jgi:hypothetical protein
MPNIEDYALLGDLHTAALVSTAGSIDWLCLPRFDSPAVFAALLHNQEAGHWTLAPRAATTCTTRRYAGNTLMLETDWVIADGAVRVIDFMPPRAATPHLIRIVVGLSGEVAMRSVIRLRFDYGRVVPWVRHDVNRADAIAGPDRVRLMSAVPVHGCDRDTFADFTVHKGDRVWFVMSWAPSHEPEMPPVDPEQALSETERFWTEWSDEAAYQNGPYRGAVDRSLITLKALTYQPTGGIVAAATTSLPEELGGVCNWDYRYCWLRDATYTLQALLAAGYRLFEVPAGQVVEAGVPPVRELHVLPGLRIQPPPGPAAAVLVDAQVRHRGGSRAQHPISPAGERVMDRRPRQPGVPGCLRRGDAPLRDLAGGLLPQPPGDPAPRRHLRQVLRERLPLAGLHRALPPPLDPPQVNGVAGAARVPRPRQHRLVRPVRQHPAARARRSRGPVRDRPYLKRAARPGLRVGHPQSFHAEQRRRRILEHDARGFLMISFLW